MKINKDRFDEWATSIWKSQETYTASRAAKVAGVSKSSFFFQRSKDYVEATIIVDLSRALQLNPLNELLRFDEFKIFSKFQEPSPMEVLSQVNPEFLMEELIARLHHEVAEHDLGVTQEPSSLKRWLDAVDMYGKYEEAAQKLDLANVRVLSKKINENRLSLGQLVALCEYANLNSRMGLVVTGNLSWEEAGFSADLRGQVLNSSPGATLIEALWASRKWLERAVQVKEVESSVYKSFG